MSVISDQGRRLFFAARVRFAEDSVAAAVTTGTRQVVILGAGLDTFAYRNPYPELRIFEVDHPATRARKRDRLASAGTDYPETLTLVPLDFETQSLAAELESTTFTRTEPAIFVWLGVVFYLTPSAARSIPNPKHHLGQPRELLPEQARHRQMLAGSQCRTNEARRLPAPAVSPPTFPSGTGSTRAYVLSHFKLAVRHPNGWQPFELWKRTTPRAHGGLRTTHLCRDGRPRDLTVVQGTDEYGEIEYGGLIVSTPFVLLPNVFTYPARPRNAIIARSTWTTCAAVSRPIRAWTFDLASQQTGVSTTGLARRIRLAYLNIAISPAPPQIVSARTGLAATTRH